MKICFSFLFLICNIKNILKNTVNFPYMTNLTNNNHHLYFLFVTSAAAAAAVAVAVTDDTSSLLFIKKIVLYGV